MRDVVTGQGVTPHFADKLSGEVRGLPLSPPLRTQHESFQLTALKPYFKRDLTWVLCTCL